MAKAPKSQPDPPEQALLRIKKVDEIILLPKSSEYGDTVYESPSKQRARAMRQAMRHVAKIFEECGGNVTVTCMNTGMTRTRFYAWLNGTQPHHRYFQKLIAKARPLDTVLDYAEKTVNQKVQAGDLTAAMFTINKLGHRRGWQEPGRGDQPNPQVIADAAVKAVQAYQLWLTDNPDASESEKNEWLGRFSSALNVDQKEVVRTMKIQELTASVQ